MPILIPLEGGVNSIDGWDDAGEQAADDAIAVLIPQHIIPVAWSILGCQITGAAIVGFSAEILTKLTSGVATLSTGQKLEK